MPNVALLFKFNNDSHKNIILYVATQWMDNNKNYDIYNVYSNYTVVHDEFNNIDDFLNKDTHPVTLYDEYGKGVTQTVTERTGLFVIVINK